MILDKYAGLGMVIVIGSLWSFIVFLLKEMMKIRYSFNSVNPLPYDYPLFRKEIEEMIV